MPEPSPQEDEDESRLRSALRLVAAVAFGGSAILLADPLRMFPGNAASDTAILLLLVSSLILLGVEGLEKVLKR